MPAPRRGYRLGMDILVAILAIALLAAIAFAVVQYRRGSTHATADRSRRSRSSPLPRGAARSNHPMAAAVEEHAQAVDPQEAAVAEQRLQARAGQVAAGLNATAHRSAAAEHQRAADRYDDADYTDPGRVDDAGYSAAPAGGAGYDPASSANYEDPHRDGSIDPVTGERIDGYGDPANDPRYDDPRYDGRLAADYDPQPDNRAR
jgi:hypothetical protein